MIHIRQYLITVIAVAVICAVVRALTRKKGVTSAIVNLTSAVFLVVTVISPWTNWSYSGITEHIKDYSDIAEAIVNNGVYAAQTETASIIKSKTETYIVDKAKSFGVEVQVDVTLSEDAFSRPETVRIKADTSPYLKQKIAQFISADLGIPEADQVWI